jgi:hypothetical protein
LCSVVLLALVTPFALARADCSGSPECAISASIPLVLRRPWRELEAIKSNTASVTASIRSKFIPPVQRRPSTRLCPPSARLFGCRFPCASYTLSTGATSKLIYLFHQGSIGPRCPLPVCCATNLVVDVEIGSRCFLQTQHQQEKLRFNIAQPNDSSQTRHYDALYCEGK